MKSGYKLFFAYVAIGLSIVFFMATPVSAGLNTWYENLALELNITQNSHTFYPVNSSSGDILLGVNSTYDTDIIVTMDGWKTHNITLDTRSFVINLNTLSYHHNESGNITHYKAGRDPDNTSRQRHKFNVSYKDHNLDNWRFREWVFSR